MLNACRILFKTQFPVYLNQKLNDNNHRIRGKSALHPRYFRYYFLLKCSTRIIEERKNNQYDDHKQF